MSKQNVTDKEVYERVVKCLEALLKISHKDLLDSNFIMTPNTDVFKDIGLDSIEIMDLIGIIEGEFKLKISAEDVSGYQKIGEIADFVKEQISGG